MLLKTELANILGYQGELGYEAEYPLLEVPVRVRSNNVQVMKNAGVALGHWQNCKMDKKENFPELTVDIILQETDSGPPPDEYKFTHRYRDGIYLASCGDNLLLALRNSGKAIAYVTNDLLENVAAFNWFVVEALSLFLVTYGRRVPIHASAVTNGDISIAFIGNSGAGKSSLAYTFLKSGFGLLAEDVIYMGMGDDFKVWGNSTRIHLLPDAINLFPELEGRIPIKRPNGKVKIQIPISEFSNPEPVFAVDNMYICVIEPNHLNNKSYIKPVSREYVSNFIMSSLEPGFNLEFENLKESMDKLLCCNLYLLTAGKNLADIPDMMLELDN